MTRRTCRRSAMLPGFRRILCTPAAMASRARSKWKCTSATMGTGDLADDLRQGGGVVAGGHGHADDLAAGLRPGGGSARRWRPRRGCACWSCSGRSPARRRRWPPSPPSRAGWPSAESRGYSMTAIVRTPAPLPNREAPPRYRPRTWASRIARACHRRTGSGASGQYGGRCGWAAQDRLDHLARPAAHPAGGRRPRRAGSTGAPAATPMPAGSSDSTSAVSTRRIGNRSASSRQPNVRLELPLPQQHQVQRYGLGQHGRRGQRSIRRAEKLGDGVASRLRGRRAARGQGEHHRPGRTGGLVVRWLAQQFAAQSLGRGSIHAGQLPRQPVGGLLVVRAERRNDGRLAGGGVHPPQGQRPRRRGQRQPPLLGQRGEGGRRPLAIVRPHIVADSPGAVGAEMMASGAQPAARRPSACAASTARRSTAGSVSASSQASEPAASVSRTRSAPAGRSSARAACAAAASCSQRTYRSAGSLNCSPWRTRSLAEVRRW